MENQPSHSPAVSIDDSSSQAFVEVPNASEPSTDQNQPHTKNSLIGHEFRPVDLRMVQVDRIVGLIASSIVATAVIVGLVIAVFQMGFTLLLCVLVAAGIFAIALIFLASYFWPVWSHHRTSYRIDDEGLEIRRGVIWRHRITIPLGRVQHADVSQGPIQRMFGIGTLTVHTAGTQNASIELVGLEHGLAESIRDLIVHQRKGLDAV